MRKRDATPPAPAGLRQQQSAAAWLSVRRPLAMEERKAAFGRLAVIVVLEGRLARRHEARPQVSAAVDLVGLGMKLNGHQAEALGTAQIETIPGDAEAVFGLAAKEFGCDHSDWTDIGARGS